ncbi:MAG: ribosome silencing factor [Psychrobium sp.]|nr:ribosome silencing factor [Psychrobium sp.]
MQGTQLLDFIINNLEDMKVKNVVTLDVTKLSPMADKLVICTATSSRHCRAVANNLLVDAKKAGIPPLGIEGMKDGGWVLLDMNDVVIHVMDQEHRDFYNLEELWSGNSKHING